MTVVGLEAGNGLSDSKADQVYEAICTKLFQGTIPPARSISLRTLAAELNVSPMPVREAVRRLIAEKALELQTSNKRLRVPDLTEDRLEQLGTARLWVEPELARRAAARMTSETLQRLKDDDATLMRALERHDVAGYMQANQDFHFTIYRAAGADLLFDLARTLWLQAGPFMRVVFGKLETIALPRDHHQDLIEALGRRDSEASRESMRADIAEGMDLMHDALRTPVVVEAKRSRGR